MGELKVTIAICTWNRCKRLNMTLYSLERLSVPQNVDFEVLVVDNGSDDDTQKVVESFRNTLPIRSVIEGNAGLSYARNRAAQSSISDYIIFTDDDVLVDCEWLVSYCKAFRQWPDAVVFGGPIEPEFEGFPPKWLAEILNNIGYVFGRQSFGEDFVELDIQNVENGPYGGNMAMARSVFTKHKFDVTLGVKQGTYNIGEETSLIREIITTGAKGWWTPDAKLKHVIPKGNEGMRYIRRWMTGAGRHDELMDNHKNKSLFNTLLLILVITKEESLYLLKCPFLSARHWIGHIIKSSKAKGRLLQRKKCSEQSQCSSDG